MFSDDSVITSMATSLSRLPRAEAWKEHFPVLRLGRRLDEVIEAADLCDSQELTRLRAHLDNQLNAVQNLRGDHLALFNGGLNTGQVHDHVNSGNIPNFARGLYTIEYLRGNKVSDFTNGFNAADLDLKLGECLRDGAGSLNAS